MFPVSDNSFSATRIAFPVRGQSPFSYCGGVWDVEKAVSLKIDTDNKSVSFQPACYLKGNDPEMCICSMHMCNSLLEPAPLMTTTAALGDRELC